MWAGGGRRLVENVIWGEARRGLGRKCQNAVIWGGDHKIAQKIFI